MGVILLMRGVSMLRISCSGSVSVMIGVLKKKFVNIKDIPVYAFDPTLRIFLKLRGMWLHPRILFDYWCFFRNTHHHIQKFVSFDTSPTHISVQSLLTQYMPSNAENMFFKIDIEGDEYRILNDLILNADKITGLIIEFHDVDLHIEKIEVFVKNFPLNVCHVHINTYARVTGEGLPTVIELSFTKFDLRKTHVKTLPHSLDMVNKKNHTYPVIQFI